MKPFVTEAERARTERKRAKLQTIGRSVDEWIGATPDQKVPAHVRARIFERERGVCWLSKRKIRPGEAWELDHRLALCNGGEHRESNLAPALVNFHKSKTAQDVRTRAKTDRIKRKHLGIKDLKPNGFRGWRKMNGEIVWRDQK
jgi:5-methylcytosine-specific restriction protein A